MKAGHAQTQHPALHSNRPDALMAFNGGILHFWPFAKNAVAFPRMSRSIFTRASSARSRLISICSAVTSLRRLVSSSFPARCAFTQFGRLKLYFVYKHACYAAGILLFKAGSIRSRHQ